MLALDIASRLAATGLVVSMVPTTLAGHAFWQAKDETARKMQTIQFLKSLAIIGDLLLLATDCE